VLGRGSHKGKKQKRRKGALWGGEGGRKDRVSSAWEAGLHVRVMSTGGGEINISRIERRRKRERTEERETAGLDREELGCDTFFVRPDGESYSGEEKARKKMGGKSVLSPRRQGKEPGPTHQQNSEVKEGAFI